LKNCSKGVYIRRVSKLVIHGGKPLSGEITACGNKNAILPMIAASLLTTEEVILENVPDIRDVANMLEIVEYLGARVERGAGRVVICAAHIEQTEIPWQLCEKTRTSFLMVAPLLHRTGRIKLSPPGGDRGPGRTSENRKSIGYYRDDLAYTQAIL
jgi:UDP-N-acetylglucosamine 1-carboxyvinyltransferase